MALNTTQLRAIMPRLTEVQAEKYLPHLNAAASEFGLFTTTRRAAAFLAQIAHESGELRWWEEIWGPTPAQRRYEGRRDLGNVHPGDGFKYRGRGPIQITGRANYRTYGEKLGLSLEDNPDLAEQPNVGFRIAGAFWNSRNLSPLADKGDFRAVTKRINGGYTGLVARISYYRRALKVLSG